MTAPILRLAGAAAALGGTFRIMTAFVPDALGLPLWTVYLVIDLLLLAGWAGIYFAQARAGGIVGVVLSLLIAAAILVLIYRDITHTDIYYIVVTMLSIALAVMGLVMLRIKIFPAWIPLLWIASFLAGLASKFLGESALLAFQFAGALFGAGYLGAGLSLLFGRITKPARD